MAAPRSPVAIAREISDSTTLTPVEQSAYRLCRQRASEGKGITQLDINLAIGSQNYTGSTAAGVLNRLERKGYITRTIFQRGVQVTITETGERTAQPPCQSTHWRQRTQPVQTPPIAVVRATNMSASRIIEIEAQAAGVHIQDFLMDLVFNGLNLFLERKEANA